MKREDTFRPDYLNIILNPINDKCNLKCSYCYNNEINNTKLSTVSIANPPILKWFPKLINGINSINSLNKVTFTWHGGEPLLLPDDFYKKIFTYQNGLIKKEIKFNNVMQTNGLLLDPKRIKFLIKNKVDLGVSFDGPLYENNKDRFPRRSDFSKVKGNLNYLSKNKFAFSLFIVIQKNNIHSIVEIFNYIKELSPINGVNFLPVFNKGSFLDPQEYTKFLKNLFNHWWPKRKPYVAIYENIIDGLNYQIPRFCFFKDRCDAFISIDAEGNLYSTCQVRKSMKVGKLNNDNFCDLLNKHFKKIQNEYGNSPEISPFLLLKEGGEYRYFFGKGCLKRFVSKKDPYLKTYASVIPYIKNRIG